MSFLLAHQSIVHHDAIGQDILGMYGILARSRECHVYGEHLIGVDRCRALPREALMDFVGNPANTVIYHHSNYWPDAGQWMKGARAKIVFKYHNLTPPEFFEGYADYAGKCRLGREQTRWLMAEHPRALWLGDSRFNLLDAGADTGTASFVVPPFVPLTYPGEVQPDAELLRSLIDDARIHVLFTGRIVPNKGHHLLVSVLREFVDRHGGGIVAHVIGKLDPVCQSYYDDVWSRAEESGVGRYLQ
ncbi:MAG: hypothetical protein M1541_02005, partial [Acidobacteria bacterium]|nr:hypothetical protein [Acidobacteriota bacterium]